MSDLARLGAGAQRMVDTVLRGTGGRSVLLRQAVPGESGDLAAQLGIATSEFLDVELSPVVLRPLGRGVDAMGGERWELLVSARATTAITGVGGAADALALFAGVLGVVVDGVVMRVGEVSYRDLSGVPYLYRVELQAPSAAAI